MSESEAYGDAFNQEYWRAATRRQLVLQHCRQCDHYQFYGRPFCLHCESDIQWVEVPGTGTVYSMTTVRRQLLPEPPVPYIVAVVELDEGPRMLTNIEGEGVQIGDRVQVAWRDRENAPPLPIFVALGGVDE